MKILQQFLKLLYLFQFASLMVIIFILELSGGIAGYVLRNNAAELIGSKMHGTMSKYGHNNSEITEVWDKIQEKVSN